MGFLILGKLEALAKYLPFVDVTTQGVGIKLVVLLGIYNPLIIGMICMNNGSKSLTVCGRAWSCDTLAFRHRAGVFPVDTVEHLIPTAIFGAV